MFASPACFLNRCYLHFSTITSFFSQMSVAWRPESFPHVARDFPQKNPLISQKVAQKLLKESQKFLFVAKVAQKLLKKIVPWFVRTFLLPLVIVTAVIMASSNINKLSMMIGSTSSLDQVYQKLLSYLWKRG